MGLHDLIGDIQSQAHTAGAAMPLQIQRGVAYQWIKERGQQTGGDWRALIAHREDNLRIFGDDRKLNIAVRRTVLDRITQQIGDDLAQASAVAVASKITVNIEAYRTMWIRRFNFLQHLAAKQLQIY